MFFRKKLSDTFMNNCRMQIKKKITLIAAALLLAGYYCCLPKELFKVPYATVVTDRYHELLGARIAADGQWRFPPASHVPEKFKQCLIAFEDRYFYYHWGVNPLAIGRAIRQNIRKKKIVSGGSTITMQVVRLAGNKHRTVATKILEAILATRLEFRCSKEEILALYASHAPFGGNVVGLEAASWRYFGHDAARLSWAEAAVLAVLPNAPSALHLSKNREALLDKRNRLLKKLLDRGVIDRSTFDLSLSEPLPSQPLPLPSIAPHRVSYFHRHHPGRYTVSAIDKGLQLQVEHLLDRWHGELIRSDIRNLAAIVIDVKTDSVLAYCGNVRFEDENSGNQVDIVRSPRSTGSILKPLLYCAMLQDGELLPNMLLPDVPVNINGFAPQNFNLQFDGAVPAAEALARSLNVPAVQMLRRYSVQRFYDFLKKMGFTTLNRPASHYGLSLILGGAEATLWDVSRSYAKMARSLLHRETSAAGAAAVYQTFQAITEVNRPEEINLRDIRSIQIIAWKTGTSYGFRDGWAVGVTAGYVVGVWAGNANGEGRPGLTGARTAGPVMFDIFNLLPAEEWFARPSDEMVEAEVCRRSGYLKNPFCEETDTVLICPAGLKTDACPCHIEVNVTDDERYRVHKNCAGNAAGIVRKAWFVLPPAWEWYYKRHHPWYKPLPPFKPGCSSDGTFLPMQFIYPQNHTRVFLPRQLDGTPGEIVFELAHSNNRATVYWHLDDEYITATQNFHKQALSPSPGKHSITVVDDEGNTLSITTEFQ
jgi:penicillin-binding protein 1C